MENFKNYKFDVIILAGQSNAEGNGVKKDNNCGYTNDDLYQLCDKNGVSIDVEHDAKIICVMPVESIIEKAHERSVDGKFLADFSETFARHYIEDGKLSEGRKLLIVKTPVGGTGFAKKQWGIGYPLYERLIQMVDYAMNLNAENRIVALLWHQGEHDAFENADFTYSERYDFYKKNFLAQMREIRKRYKGSDFPIITGEFVDDWSLGYKEACDAVEKALKDSCAELGNAAMVKSDGLLSNDQAYSNGDTIHFCDKSIYELGDRYYEEYKKLV